MPFRVHPLIQYYERCMSYSAGLRVACDSLAADDHCFQRYNLLFPIYQDESLYNLGFDRVWNWYKLEEGLYK